MAEAAYDNIDQSEIDKFGALASRWWDPEGELKTLHDINPLRLQFMADQAKLAGRQVADIGCGGGLLSEALREAGAEVTAVDASDQAIRVARMHAMEAELTIDYQCMTAEQLCAERPESFDVLSCMEMLEHVPEPDAVIRACAGLLKPGGVAVFSTIARTPKAWLSAIIGAEYVLGLIPRGTHEYRKLIRPSELSTWGREAGLSLTSLRGMAYNPFSRQARLHQDVSVNYLISFQKAA